LAGRNQRSRVDTNGRGNQKVKKKEKGLFNIIAALFKGVFIAPVNSFPAGVPEWSI